MLKYMPVDPAATYVEMVLWDNAVYSAKAAIKSLRVSALSESKSVLSVLSLSPLPGEKRVGNASMVNHVICRYC